MNRKIIALFLAVLMVAVIPVTALAEPEEAENGPRTAEPAAAIPAQPEGAEAAGTAENVVPAETPGIPEGEIAASPASGRIHIDIEVNGPGTLQIVDKNGVPVTTGETGVEVEPGTVLLVEAAAQKGAEYVQAVYSGGSLEVAEGPDNTEQLALTAEKSGTLEVTFASKSVPQHEIKIVTSGALELSYSTGAGEKTAAAGDVVSFPEGTTVLFRAVPLRGSSFDGASFNDHALAAAKQDGAWVTELTVRESGTLSVRATSSCTVSTILSNVELRYDNGGTWQTVREGDDVLSLPAGNAAYFAVVPDEGCVLSSLLVNGEEVTRVGTAGGEYRFSAGNVRGELVITAIAEARTENIQGIDSKTGVRYVLPGTQQEEDSNITQDSWISVVEVTRGAAYEKACIDAEPYGSLLSVYDLTLHNESGSYEPSVPILVSFPVPSSFTGGSLKVLHAAARGVLEVPYRREDIQGISCVTIAADAFSLYMLVDAPAEEPAVGPANTGTTAGGNASWGLPVLILAICLTLLAVFLRKRQAAH